MIISATDKNTKTLIARYFNPVKVEEPAKAQKGIHGVPERTPMRRAQTRPRRAGASPLPSEAKLRGTRPTRAPPSSSSHPPTPSSVPPPDPAKPYPTMSERELFNDPHEP